MKYFAVFICALSFMFSLNATAYTLYWFSGAGIKKPAEIIASMFNKTHKDKVVIISGGSGQVLNEMIETKKGDIYSLVDSNFLHKAIKNHIVIKYKKFLKLTPIFALSKNGEKKIENFYDLSKHGIKIAGGNTKTICLGKTFQAVIDKLPKNMSSEIEKNVVVRCLNVFQILGYVKNNSVDAGIILDRTLLNNTGLHFINIPKQYNVNKYGYLCLISYSKHKKEAKKLYNFVIKHLNIYQKCGFKVIGAD